MVQVFTILLVLGLALLFFNFLFEIRKKMSFSWSLIRMLGYFLVAVSSVFFTLINPNWFYTFEGYACAVLIAFFSPLVEEMLLFFVWAVYRRNQKIS